MPMLRTMGWKAGPQFIITIAAECSKLRNTSAYTAAVAVCDRWLAGKGILDSVIKQTIKASVTHSNGRHLSPPTRYSGLLNSG